MSQWRLHCPDCGRRTMHRETTVGQGVNATTVVVCAGCGSRDALDDRVAFSRKKDPNPDRERDQQADLSGWSA
ncbi:hypothetical protein ACFQH6_19345 [Halobacteriaceae archaeon GCM10025711]